MIEVKNLTQRYVHKGNRVKNYEDSSYRVDR